MTNRIFITQTEAAELTGLSEVTIRRRISTGDLPAYRSGRLIRLRRDEVEAMFKPIPTRKSRKR